MLKYFFSSDVEPFESPTNDGLEDVSGLLDQLREQGVPIDQIDVAQLTEKERTKAYFDAVGVSVLKKYKIRQVFGSRRLSGTSFGKHVPALIVRNLGSDFPEEVFPHQESGEVVPIAVFLRAYLDELLKSPPKNLDRVTER